MKGYVTYTIVPPMAVWNSSYIELIGMKYVKILILINLGKKLKKSLIILFQNLSPYKNRLPPKNYMDEQTKIVKS